MRRFAPLALLSLLALLALAPGTALCGNDLDSFVAGLAAQAQVDLPGFKARVSATLGVPVARIDAVIGKVSAPEDAYMVMKVGQLSHRSDDEVIREYDANRGRGWGVIAKNLGIKPGSREFHELKRGFDDDGDGRGKGKKEKKGKSRGKGRGHGNDD